MSMKWNSILHAVINNEESGLSIMTTRKKYRDETPICFMNERQGKYRRNRANASTMQVGHTGSTSYLFLRCVAKIVWMPQC